MISKIHPLYKAARELSRRPIDWSDPELARLQQEARLDYTGAMSTFDLITTVVTDEKDVTAMLMTLTEIMAAPQQGRTISLDDALGQGRN